VVERLKAYVKTKNLPHLIFAGPAGTGKTTSALALAREIFGEEFWRQNFYELNASDERGIGVIRGKIKDFARTAPIGNTPFKIIFLDEADSLTPDAQAALRRTIERYTSICRFILSANYSSKIIEPIQSRCTVFRFKPIRGEDIKKYMRKIAVKERIEITPDGLESIIFISRGDLRKAINILQVGASVNKRITADLLYETSATAKPEEIKELMNTALSGNFIGARNQLYNLLIKYGLSGEDILKQMHHTIFDLTIPDENKVELLEKTGETEFRIVEGSNEHIQLESLVAQFVLMGKKLKF
jgi:replication factor C small subunit